MSPSRRGVSAVICAHNARSRVRPCLEHLAGQRLDGLAWEVVVVDSASTDGTASVAREVWNEYCRAPTELRVISESQPGLSVARKAGIAASRFDTVTLVDDDNLLLPDYLARAERVLFEHRAVGAVGGRSVLPVACSPPPWFEEFRQAFAVGDQASAGGVLVGKATLWGAGLTLRASAMRDLYGAGFECLLTDRTADTPHSGGDTELCLALRMKGWDLYYDPEICLVHAIAPIRLSLAHLLQLSGSFGRASVIHSQYWRVARRGRTIDASQLPLLLLVSYLDVLRLAFLRSAAGLFGRRKLSLDVNLAYQRGTVEGVYVLMRDADGLRRLKQLHCVLAPQRSG